MATFAERLISPIDREADPAVPAAPRPHADVKSLRILHCLRAPVGGLFRHVLDLAAEQAARGHAVGILADANTGNALTAEKLDAIAPHLALGVHLVPMRRQPGISDIGASLAVTSIARHLTVDVLHGHGAKGGTYARLAAMALRAMGHGTRCFYTPHGGSLHFAPGTWTGRSVAVVERMLAWASDGVVFESVYARATYRRHIGGPRCAARVIHNGLQDREFAPIMAQDGAADFVFVGELRKLKGVDLLLAALATLQRERPVRAVVVGDGPDAAEFRAEAERLGLTDTVTFPGALPATSAFRLGRCLVVPSRAESLPYVVLEAAAARIPVIATNVGGIPEIVMGTSTALVRADDVGALTAAMRTFLASPVRAAEQAGELSAAVRKTFNAVSMTDAVLAFYAAAD